MFLDTKKQNKTKQDKKFQNRNEAGIQCGLNLEGRLKSIPEQAEARFHTKICHSWLFFWTSSVKNVYKPSLGLF